MKIINLSEGNSLLNQYVAELRDVHVQNDRMRFRRNIERIGEIKIGRASCRERVLRSV